jgi:hypothetical protein
MKTLIILFGHENDQSRKLKQPALSRCATAADEYKRLSEDSEVKILPTGSFGEHFNLTNTPHWQYLKKQLEESKVPSRQILNGTMTSNTIDDCIAAWHVFEEKHFDKIVVVTSDYHLARVLLILRRLRGNQMARIDFKAASTPDEYDGTDMHDEASKISSLLKGWEGKRQLSLGNIYENADREHKHYDTMSLAVVSAMFVVNAFAIAFVPGKGLGSKILLVIILLFMNLFLLVMYVRMAEMARTARKVLFRIEFEKAPLGFSTSWTTRGLGWFLSSSRLTLMSVIIYLAVLLYVALLLAIFIV